MNWTYAESDPGLMLFTAAVERFGLDFAPGSTILEIGCAETNFLERLHRMDPTLELTGLDWRKDREPHGWTQVIGDATTMGLFPLETFDAIVMIGALEHFGLGYYTDPVHLQNHDFHGDVLTMINALYWLKPGGRVYFDVPCNPTDSITKNRHFRIYAPETVGQRLVSGACLRELARGYSEPEPHAGTWVEQPTVEKVPYWYCAVLAEKAA
jgi:SAM-dependent methyltransferase